MAIALSSRAGPMVPCVGNLGSKKCAAAARLSLGSPLRYLSVKSPYASSEKMMMPAERPAKPPELIMEIDVCRTNMAPPSSKASSARVG